MTTPRPFAFIYHDLRDFPEPLVAQGIDALRGGKYRSLDSASVRAWCASETAAQAYRAEEGIQQAQENAQQAQRVGRQFRRLKPITAAELQAKAAQLAAKHAAEFPGHLARSAAGYKDYYCHLKHGLLAGDMGRDWAANLYERESAT